MKLNSTLLKKSLMAFAILAVITGSSGKLSAQVVCANTVYGLTATGEIRPITISPVVVGAKITPAYAAPAPSSANGLGYNNLNGKFYYFKRDPSGSTQQFVSFDPATNLVSVLASCPTTNSVHTGCVTNNSLGYYTLDVNARLYYYNIVLNTWTLITTKFFNQFGTNITATITTQSSGDIAMDGKGNLWMLTSSNTNFGLFEIMAAVPTTAVASITANQIVAPTTVTPSGNSFGGFAFNSTGQMILATYSSDQLYILDNTLTLTFLGSLAAVPGIGNDLTSCNYPLSVLPLIWEGFTATLKNSHDVLLNWTVAQQNNNQGFHIENSQNGADWSEIGYVKNDGSSSNTASYTFTSVNPVNGNQYYRLRQVDVNGAFTYSETKLINIKSNTQVAIWPNPASDYIRIQNENTGAANGSKALLFDLSGRMVNQTILHSGLNSVNIASLPSGTYVVRVQLTNGETYNQKLLKN